MDHLRLQVMVVLEFPLEIGVVVQLSSSDPSRQSSSKSQRQRAEIHRPLLQRN
jgi:hypothetical protein